MSESLISEDRSLEIGRTPLPEGLKKIAKDGVPLASWAIILNGHKMAAAVRHCIRISGRRKDKQGKEKPSSHEVLSFYLVSDSFLKYFYLPLIRCPAGWRNKYFNTLLYKISYKDILYNTENIANIL